MSRQWELLPMSLTRGITVFQLEHESKRCAVSVSPTSKGQTVSLSIELDMDEQDAKAYAEQWLARMAKEATRQ